jgi:cytochrome c oxidase subunit II
MQLPLWPEAASAVAVDIDNLYIYLSAVSIVMCVLIFGVILIFALKYRRRGDEVPQPIHGSLRLEIGWSIFPFLVMLTFFWWGAKIYFLNAVPPPDAIDVYSVGKQWMWKVQYPGGQREINELHAPIGRPVKITLASEDVIHSFFIPALRIKHDVVPGHYDTMWFIDDKPGLDHLFSAEY